MSTYTELECLRHLRELRADGNQIDSVDGLQKMDGLIKLSLQGNTIRSLDLQDFKWCVYIMDDSYIGSFIIHPPWFFVWGRGHDWTRSARCAHLMRGASRVLQSTCFCCSLTSATFITSDYDTLTGDI